MPYLCTLKAPNKNVFFVYFGCKYNTNSYMLYQCVLTFNNY